MKHLLILILLSFPIIGYSQAGNFWTKKNDFSGLKRERAVAFTIDGKAYVGTGVDTAEVVHKDFWEYDPFLDAWTQVADLPASVRRNAVGFSIGSLGYVGTGIDSASASAPFSQILKDFWSYDPTLNSWTQKADYPGGSGSGIYFATGFSIGNFGYICAGKRGPNNYLNQLWKYDPSTDQWTSGPPFPGGKRYQLSSFVIGDIAYVGLGTNQDIYTKDIWAFDGITETWSARADLPASERASAMTFVIGQKGYVCMGANGGYLDDLWEYNPFSDSWSVKASYGGSARKNGVGFSLHGKGYVGTGKGYSGKKQSMQEYTPTGFAGIDELEIEINVYPNPSSDFISVETQSASIDEVSIYNSAGKLVLKEKNVAQINVSQIHSGNYIVRAHSNNQVIAQQRLIIL